MSLEIIGKQNQIELKEIELSTERKILLEFQDLQKRIRLQLSGIISEIESFKSRGEQIPVSFFAQQNRLKKVLAAVSQEIIQSTLKLAGAQRDAQAGAVKLAQRQAKKNLELHGSVFEPDVEAARALITRAQDHTPLRAFYQRIDKPIQENIRRALLQGVVFGKGAAGVAPAIDQALGTGRSHALSIARTELNEAFRNATHAHFEKNSKVIKGFIWLSARDLTTCVICWRLHGTIFKTKDRFHPHVNCRCTLVAYFGGDSGIKTGSELFKELTAAQQKAILGDARFELYKNGMPLHLFSEARETEFGKGYFIKNLEELPGSGKPGIVKPSAGSPAPAAPPKPKAAKTAPAASGKPKTSQEALSRMKALSKDLETEIVTLKATLQGKFDAAAKLIPGSLAGVPDLVKKVSELEAGRSSRILDVLRVENPTKINPDIQKGFNKQQLPKLEEAIQDFNSLISDKFMNGVRVPFVPMRKDRAFHRSGSVHLPSYNVEKPTVIHEISHALEQQNPAILKNTLEFYEHRTKGEKEQKLSKLTGNPGYKAKETAKPDKFFSPYVGKVYRNLFDGSIRATEIISMGVERYFKDPVNFGNEDPEYFDFIFKIVRGEKWEPEK